MNAKTLKKLEYSSIIDRLSALASSTGGQALCRSLVPLTSLTEIRSAQDETRDAFQRLVKKGRPSFGGCHPVEDSLRRLEIGGVLGSGELLKICVLLETTLAVRSYGFSDRSDDPEDCLVPYFSQLVPLSPLSREIRRCIIDEEEISDDASSNLKHVRRSINALNDKVHSTLSGLVNGSLRTYLQDSLITMRGDRYCVPVKAEYRGQVKGMIHDQSATGSTLFIEPMAVVNLNNDLKELYAKEQEEIQVILASLSQEAAAYIEEIQGNYSALVTLDFIFAKAALALDMDASPPIFNTDGRIKLREARHPLLDKKKVVPISLTLGESFDLLIVTGPNTGGKTVSLKTVGLLTLMGQAGLHIPALHRSELSVFRNIFADIGDEQSIEQSLSTFSSHMTNIVSFLNEVDTDSLVLFDELGAGTDPTEGAALATAILSHLHARGIRTMATTHYSELKVYALSTPGVENACCEFDVRTLRPTYRLLVGIPGKSNAFAIAGKLGLPKEIIDDARKALSSQDASFENLLVKLEQNRHSLEKEREELSSYKREAQALKDEIARKQDSLNAQRDRIIAEAKEKAYSILADAKDTADSTIRNINRISSESGIMPQLEKEREKLRSKIKETQPAVSPSSSVGSMKAKDCRPGESVKVISMNLSGVVLSPPDNKGMVQVQMGILKSQIPLSDLELVEEKPVYIRKQSSSSAQGGSRSSKSLSVSPELHLLGKTVDEAIAELDKYIDDARLAHLDTVRIVHGKGTGALRNGVHAYLRKQKHVRSFRLGTFGEGDAGVTIVELK